MEPIQSVPGFGAGSVSAPGVSGGLSAGSPYPLPGASGGEGSAPSGSTSSPVTSTSRTSTLAFSSAGSEPLQALAVLLMTLALMEQLFGDESDKEDRAAQAMGLLLLAGALGQGGGESFYYSSSSTSSTETITQRGGVLGYNAGGAAVQGQENIPQIDTVA